MKQPELGRKISELRKAKGLTQEELVEKCNLNVRTIQRIEAGEVTPRSYTVKALFEALDFQDSNDLGISQEKPKTPGFIYAAIGAGLVYFFLSFFEIGIEEEYLSGNESVSRNAFSLIKVGSYLGYILFMLGWIRLEQFYSNSILKIGVWLMIGANVIWFLVDLTALQTDFLEFKDFFWVKISSFGFFYAILGMGFIGYKKQFTSIPMIIGVLTLIAGIFLFSGFGAILALIPLTLAEIGQIGLMIYLAQAIGRTSPDSMLAI
ncbi:helix-turn-helix domain-containing protein [Algoriphagus mannitolivorans]|uniref:helix-turn-helix domain-containing protein n=1 Tax=Algoriphagus mannitolivorans TaxID=226504 RepID=UPI0012F7B75F|nr:helix-turn-helix transcriptional regulator [Algoriphagus mannitolivorans]